MRFLKHCGSYSNFGDVFILQKFYAFKLKAYLIFNVDWMKRVAFLFSTITEWPVVFGRFEIYN